MENGRIEPLHFSTLHQKDQVVFTDLALYYKNLLKYMNEIVSMIEKPGNIHYFTSVFEKVHGLP